MVLEIKLSKNEQTINVILETDISIYKKILQG